MSHAREHSTVTRSDQAELRRDGRRNGSGHKILSNMAPNPIAGPETKYVPAIPADHGAPPRPPELAPRQGCGSERSCPRATRPPRAARGRCRARPRATANRTERVGREDPPRAASARTVGDVGHVGSRAVPPEVRRDELAAPRPVRPRAHQEASANREGDESLGSPPVPARRRTRPHRERSVYHRKRGADAPPLRVHEAPASAAGDRLARPLPEEGRRLALLPILDRDPRLLGGARRLCGAPPGLPQPGSPPFDRTGRGVLLESSPVSRRGHPVSSMVPAPLSGPLLLRSPRRARCAHVPRIRGRPPDAPRPRPPRGDAQPGRELESRCTSSGYGRSELPGPWALLSARIGGPRPPEPLDYHHGLDRPAESGPVTLVRNRREIMPRAGLEPATSRSSVSHSPKLSYRGSRGPSSRKGKRFPRAGRSLGSIGVRGRRTD